MESRIRRVAALLMNKREVAPPGFWGWMSDLEGRPADKKTANKFLLACILDYQIRAEVAWENARRLVEKIFDDPDDLWGVITSYSEVQWNGKRNRYSLHRFPAAHGRVWRIGNEVVRRYGGDARKIWEGQPPSIVLRRLEDMRVGQQISRMVVGALIDTGQISGSGDLKADSNITRVLGRALKNAPLSPDEATKLARQMNPENSWLLDRPLYILGKDTCTAVNPDCVKCYLRTECLFYKSFS